MRKGDHQWPTNGATIKMVNRVEDKCLRRIKTASDEIMDLRQRVIKLEAFIHAVAEKGLLNSL